MTKKEFEALKDNDIFYIKHPAYDNLEGVYQFIKLPEGSPEWKENCKIIWQKNSLKGNDNNLCDFKMDKNHHLMEHFKLLNRDDYPEYFI